LQLAKKKYKTINNFHKKNFFPFQVFLGRLQNVYIGNHNQQTNINPYRGISFDQSIVFNANNNYS
jgi:hypothetical protein